VLKESLRDLITETAYQRPKHPFLAPPAALNQQGKLWVLIQDTLRGSSLDSIPFFEKKEVLNLLDGMTLVDECSGVADDQMLMMVLSACVLQRGFGLSA